MKKITSFFLDDPSRALALALFLILAVGATGPISQLVFQGNPPWLVTVTNTVSTPLWTTNYVTNMLVFQGTVPWSSYVTNSQDTNVHDAPFSNYVTSLIRGLYTVGPHTLTDGQSSILRMDADGDLRVNVSDPIAAGNNTIGTVNIDHTNTLASAGDVRATNFPIVTCETSFTLAADATAYASGNVINGGLNVAVAPITMTNAFLANGRGADLVSVALSASNTTWTLPIRVWLYNNTNVTWFSNRQAFATWFTNASARMTYWDLPAMNVPEGSGDTSYVVDDTQQKSLAQSADGNVYVLLEAKGTNAPVSGQPMLIKMKFKPH